MSNKELKCAIDHILDAQHKGEINEDNVLYIFENINVAGQIVKFLIWLHMIPNFLTLVYRDKVVDFHWNTYDPWTIVSVFDDCDTVGGGGILQIWRMSDLLYWPEDERLNELEKFKSHVVSCGSKV